MALVHRVNLNFNPLLGTYYCKCLINITRLKSKHTSKTQPELANDEKEPTFKTFEQMIAFRQHQARRTALVKMDSINNAVETLKFCEKYGNILSTFVYRTKYEQMFQLIEYETQTEVEQLKHVTSYKHSSEAINAITPLLIFKKLNNDTFTNKNSPLKWYPYDAFTVPSSSKIAQNLQGAKTVSEQMIILYDILKVTDLDIRLRFFTAEQIWFYLSRLFTNVSVVPFGSSVNGFGQLGCDLDLLCKIENKKSSDAIRRKLTFLSQRINLVERNEQREFLESISTLMKVCIPGMKGIKKILEARVPIIKFFNMNTNMQCDLSCTNMVALYMSELLYVYAELDWRIKPLVCTIRKWARNCNVTKETPGHWITNFSLTLLIIFYLQNKKILPSIYSLQNITQKNIKKLKQSADFMKWKDLTQNDNKENLDELLHGFFEYYSIFDFKTQAICIRRGTCKQKTDYSPLYIYNPFDTTLNVSKNITTIELSRLIEHFRIGLQILSNSPEEITIMKLINVVPRTCKDQNNTKVLILNKESHDNQQNEESSDTNNFECINQETLTNEENTNSFTNLKESIIK